MACLKIVFLAGNRQIVLYGQGMKEMWQVESHVLERLGREERQQLETAEFRKFWIDEEGDRVEIINNVDYEFFLKRSGVTPRVPKIYFEARQPTKDSEPEQPSTSSPPKGKENLSVHSTVSCDNCNEVPLRGFRYKCMQCSNFDLCMKCEAEMCHPEHLMMRIPYGDTEYEMPTLIGLKRRQRKYAAAAAAAAASGATATATGFCDGLKADGKNRHRHHRRHCSGGPGGAGILSNFYEMMQGFAEGGAVPQTSATTETPERGQSQEPSAPQQTTATAPEPPVAATAAATATAANLSKETNTSPDRSAYTANGGQNAPSGSASAPPSFENLQNLIDPNFMKAGIQILNNFSEMFGKILDPASNPDTSRPNSTPGSSVIDLVSGESRASATPPPTANGTPVEAAASKETSAAGSGIVTPMETEASPPSPPVAAPEALPRSRNSQSEENDWTMIDNNAATSSTAEATTVSSSTATATTTAAAAAAAVAAASPPLDFAKLSQQLQTHIENEMKQAKTTPALAIPAPATSQTTPLLFATQVDGPPLAAAPVTTPAAFTAPVPPTVTAPVPPTVTAPSVPYPIERRAIAVFHPDPRINDSIHAMMAMGFSNEGANLTQLLESVNGNISEALDVMSYVRRT